MLAVAKNKSLWNAAKNSREELEIAFGRMTTEQLIELAYSDPTEERIAEIFDSVGAVRLLGSV
jgi:hypothetical protein